MNKKIFTFDFSDAAAAGYLFFWQQRRMIAQLAVLPLVVKIVSFIIVTGLGLHSQILRQGLVLLPSYFLEGWLVAKLIRIAVLGEGVIPPLSGDAEKDFKMLRSYNAVLLASSIVYVLIKMLMAFFTAALVRQNEVYNQPEVVAQAAGGAVPLVLAIIALALTIWAFRFMWLHVVAALDYPIEGFLKHIKSFHHSFAIVAVWIVCFVPVILVFLTMNNMLYGVTGQGSEAALYGSSIIQAITEMVLAIISGVSMGFGFRSLYEGVPIRK